MSRQPNFDRVAHIYRWAEYFSLGPLLQQTRLHYLPRLAGCRHAVVMGDGDGRFLARLLRENVLLQALAVDTSAAMLTLLTKRCKAEAHRLTTLQASALEIALPSKTDLVVTHFFLDCLTQRQVDALAQRIGAAAQPRMLWLMSDFAVPRARFLRPLAALYIRSLYFAFRVLTGLRVTQLPDSAHALSSAGFVRIARHERVFGMLYTELWQRQ